MDRFGYFDTSYSSFPPTIILFCCFSFESSNRLQLSCYGFLVFSALNLKIFIDLLFYLDLYDRMFSCVVIESED